MGYGGGDESTCCFWTLVPFHAFSFCLDKTRPDARFATAIPFVRSVSAPCLSGMVSKAVHPYACLEQGRSRENITRASQSTYVQTTRNQPREYFARIFLHSTRLQETNTWVLSRHEHGEEKIAITTSLDPRESLRTQFLGNAVYFFGTGCSQNRTPESTNAPIIAPVKERVW